MKKIYSLLILFACLSCMNSNAQAPQGIPYQSVIRNGSGALLINQAVNVRFSIHDSTMLGTIVYQETHTVTTSNLGMVTVAIGQGTPSIATFSSINWGSGAKFMQVELDAAGGNNYIDLGTQQMMSVPYALYAAHSNDAGPAGAVGTTGATGPQGATGSSGSNGATGATGNTGATGATGLLPSGAAAGNTPYWNGSNWVTNSSNLFNNGGHVGIGTSTPASKLHVITDDASGDGLVAWGEGQAVVGKQGVHGGGLGLAYDSSNNVGTIYSLAPSLAWKNLDIRANSIRLLTEGYDQAVTTNGKVGIGTETPNAKLDVQGGNILTSGTLTAGAVTYPNSHGTSGQVLSTTGAGTLIWVTSTQGIQGLTGATGPQGNAGTSGAAGPQGSAGTNGATGTQGPIGLTGATGPQGNAGTSGATGTFPNGTTAGEMMYWNGTAWVSVAPGPGGLQGTQAVTLKFCNGVPIWGDCPAGLATLTTTAISAITYTTSSSGGTITNDGGAAVTARGVCWSTSSNPTAALSTKTIDSGTGSFTSSITGLLAVTSYYVRAYATNSVGTAYGNQVVFTTSVTGIGQSYQGGIVAYILQAGDPGYDPNVQHGLIAAPSDFVPAAWQGAMGTPYYNVYMGSYGTAIGYGLLNTNFIVNNIGNGNYAAKLCYDLVLNGYSDWFLPSKDELNKLYLNRTAIGGFAAAYYWSSSEISFNGAWSQHFFDGFEWNYLKLVTYNVRAVRAF